MLIQHQSNDPILQKNCLDNCNFEPIDLTYLLDRILVNQGKKQIYGTQFKKGNGKFIPQPIKNRAKVDALRKEICLESLEKYTIKINKIFKSKLT